MQSWMVMIGDTYLDTVLYMEDMDHNEVLHSLIYEDDFPEGITIIKGAE